MSEINTVEILLVEDDPNDAELTIRALKKHKLANRLHVVTDGAEALDFLFATGAYSERNTNVNPRLVLLDLKLPKVSGLEVLKKIKSDPKTKMIPVVVLTSSTEQQDIIKSYHLGVNSFISKPVNFEKFLNSIGEIGYYWLLLNKSPACG
jgi:two-component system response regulator